MADKDRERPPFAPPALSGTTRMTSAVAQALGRGCGCALPPSPPPCACWRPGPARQARPARHRAALAAAPPSTSPSPRRTAPDRSPPWPHTPASAPQSAPSRQPPPSGCAGQTCRPPRWPSAAPPSASGRSGRQRGAVSVLRGPSSGSSSGACWAGLRGAQLHLPSLMTASAASFCPCVWARHPEGRGRTGIERESGG